jgi:hypothetical protein
MAPDLYAYLLDLAFQDWARWRAAYLFEKSRWERPDPADLQRLNGLLVNMDRAMRDFMLVGAQRETDSPPMSTALAELR